MKQRISIILIISLLLCLYGCAKDASPAKIPVNFYYLAKDISYNGKSEILQYLKGPVSDTLRSPFPAHVRVTRYATTANMAILELSTEFAQLTGIDLTVACSCLNRTLFDLTQLERVMISVTDAQLDGQASITFDLNDIYFVDTPSSDETPDATVSPAP